MIELRTLGTLDLRRRDGPELLSVLSQPKRAALLCYLALARPRGFHKRDRLLPLFWPEADAEHARASLRQAIHRLRDSLGEAVIRSRGDEDLGLDGSLLWCDAVAFEEALDADEAERALGLYDGELLPGLHVQEAAEFDRWLEAERTRLRERAVRGAWSLAQAREREGDAARAAEWGRRALALAPADEVLLRGYMELSARVGDPGGAENAYQGYARLLREEFDLTPTAEVRALAEEIRNRPPGRIALASPRPPVAALPRRAVEKTTSPALVARAPRRPMHRYLWPTLAAVVVLVAGGFAVRAWHARRAVLRVEAHSIAVLPLIDLGPGQGQGAFADGVTAELIDQLGRIPGLRVPGPTASFYFKGRADSLPLDEIARRFRAAYILEGTVLRQDSQVRAAVRLTRAATGRQLWQQDYTTAGEDEVALQRQIARYVAGTFALRAPDIPARLPAKLEAYDLYLQGLFAWRNAPFDPNSVTSQQAAAAEFFRKAIALDPAFAHARAGLAEAHYRAGDFPQAKAEAVRALALDSTLALAHHALAASLGFGDWRWGEAERALERGMRLTPASAQLHMARAGLRFVLGRKSEAYLDYRRALTLDPLLLEYQLAWADALTRVGWYREAFAVLDSLPGPVADSRLVHRQAAVAAGLREQALALARADGDEELVTVLEGNAPAVIALASRTRTPCHGSYLLWLFIMHHQNRPGARNGDDAASRAAELRQVSAAHDTLQLACLEFGVKLHGSWVAFSMRSHTSDSLRAHPRFRALMRQVGLPD